MSCFVSHEKRYFFIILELMGRAVQILEYQAFDGFDLYRARLYRQTLDGSPNEIYRTIDTRDYVCSLLSTELTEYHLLKYYAGENSVYAGFMVQGSASLDSSSNRPNT